MSSTRRNRSRRWCFTLNNYTEVDLSQCLTRFHEAQYAIGKEVGESGTPHLQGYLEFKFQKDFKWLQEQIPGAHIEKAKGKRDVNYAYCTKEGDFVTNIEMRTNAQKLKDMCMMEYKDVVWKEWQIEIINILKEKPDSRKIHWYWEESGNVGKSFLAKYLALTFDVIICDGKKDNIFHQVAAVIEAGRIPNIVILDIPRSAQEYVNYGVLESLKGGMLYSGKYEGAQLLFPHPHVIAFSNELPDTRAMSGDRWVIKEINTPPAESAQHFEE